MRSGSVQSSLICPIFRKDFRGPKGGEAQRARPEEKKTPFRIQQTAYGFSRPFSEEPQGNGYKTNKPEKRKREKPLPSTAARGFPNATARPADSVLRRTTFRPVHSKNDCPDERPALCHRTRSGTESSARISERRKKHEPACPYDRIGDRQQQRIEKTYGKPSCLAVRGHPRRPGPQPGPCIFRHRAFRIGGNQAFASLRPRRWASRSIHPISTTPNTILSANSTLMFRFLSRTFSAMKPACNRMMTIVP